jgi:hypothetical protein
VEIDAGQLGVIVEHLLKVGCTVQYVWLPADRSSCSDGCKLEPIRSSVRACPGLLYAIEIALAPACSGPGGGWHPVAKLWTQTNLIQ